MIYCGNNLLLVYQKITSSILWNVFSLLDINECESNPCENGGTCMNLEDGYSCACEPGFTGTVCQTGTRCREFGNMKWIEPIDS